MYHITDDEFEAFQQLVYAETGIVLNDSKRCLLCSRLAKRLRALHLNDYIDYYDYLLRRDSGGVEMQEMINCITTNKTDFFRESHHFEFLASHVMPEVVARAAKGGPRRLRIWSAACSLGHEPYSIAITVRESAVNDPTWDVRILASDIDTLVLAQAADGVFDQDDLAPAGDMLLRRYFDRGVGAFAGKVRAKSSLRSLLTFRQINLIHDAWPIRARFDVIFCRNVMIYFDTETQRRVVERLVQYLNPGGYLMLGHSESIQWSPNPLRSLGNTVFQLVEAGAGKSGIA
ncbi:MAG: chemotaxis protein CheR [Planctomycetota bacterium]|nr:MAG: chemotaxis protein CheR [Planctomycetota bacterium]